MPGWPSSSLSCWKPRSTCASPPGAPPARRAAPIRRGRSSSARPQALEARSSALPLGVGSRCARPPARWRKAASLLMSGRGAGGWRRPCPSRPGRARFQAGHGPQAPGFGGVLGQQHEVEARLHDAAGSVHAADGDQLHRLGPGSNQIGQQQRAWPWRRCSAGWAWRAIVGRGPSRQF